MDCMNCTANIPPEWKACIQENKCPSCGKEIMNNNSKELLDELRDAMAKMPNDPEGLAGWLLSNYRLQKVGSAEPTQFFQSRNQNDDMPKNIKIANNPVHDFLKRSGNPELVNRKKLSDIVKDIQKNAELAEQGEYDSIDDISDNYEEYDYPDPYSDYVDEPQVSAKVLANNSLLVGGGGPPPTDDDKAALHQALAMGGNIQGLNDLPPALQRDRLKRLMQQQGVANGGGQGVFRRG